MSVEKEQSVIIHNPTTLHIKETWYRKTHFQKRTTLYWCFI